MAMRGEVVKRVGASARRKNKGKPAIFQIHGEPISASARQSKALSLAKGICLPQRHLPAAITHPGTPEGISQPDLPQINHKKNDITPMLTLLYNVNSSIVSADVGSDPNKEKARGSAGNSATGKHIRRVSARMHPKQF
jgi:hypothetical protein